MSDIQTLSRVQMERWLRDHILTKEHMVLRTIAAKSGLNESDALRYQIVWIVHWLLDRWIEISKKGQCIEIQNSKLMVEGDKMGLIHHGKDQLGMQMSKGHEIDNELLTGKFIPILATFITQGQALMPAANEIDLKTLTRYLPPDPNTFAPPPPPPGLTSVVEVPDFEKKPEPPPIASNLVPPVPTPEPKRPRGRPTKEKETVSSLSSKIDNLTTVMANLANTVQGLVADNRVQKTLNS